MSDRMIFKPFTLILLLLLITCSSASFQETAYAYTTSGSIDISEQSWQDGVPNIDTFGQVGKYYDAGQAKAHSVAIGYSEYKKATTLDDSTYTSTGDGLKWDGFALYDDGLSSQNMVANGSGSFCSLAPLPSEQFMQANTRGSGNNGRYQVDKMQDGPTYSYSQILGDIDATDGGLANATITAQLRASATTGYYSNSTAENYHNDNFIHRVRNNGQTAVNINWFGDTFAGNRTTNQTTLVGS